MSNSQLALHYFAHWIACLPLLACAIVVLRKQALPPAAYGLMLAFLVSFFQDSAALFLRNQHMTNVWLQYVFSPIQFVWLVWVVAHDRAVRTVAVSGVLLAAVNSAQYLPYRHFETITQTMGGAIVVILILSQQKTIIFRPALLVYCGLAIPFILAMGAFPPAVSGPWYGAWLSYQAMRAIGLSLFTYALVWRPRLKVIDGPGIDEVARNQWRPFGRRRPRGLHLGQTPAVARNKTG